MGRKVTIEVELLNDAIPDDRVAYMVFGALDRSRIKAVQVGDVRAADEITKTDEQRVRERRVAREKREARDAEPVSQGAAEVGSRGDGGKAAAGEDGASG